MATIGDTLKRWLPWNWGKRPPLPQAYVDAVYQYCYYTYNAKTDIYSGHWNFDEVAFTQDHKEVLNDNLLFQALQAYAAWLLATLDAGRQKMMSAYLANDYVEVSPIPQSMNYHRYTPYLIMAFYPNTSQQPTHWTSNDPGLESDPSEAGGADPGSVLNGPPGAVGGLVERSTLLEVGVVVSGILFLWAIVS